MGISRGAVKSHTARGMSALKSILEREGEIEQAEVVSDHPAPETVTLPIFIYLADEAIHAQVEAAVEEWLATAGVVIEERQQPVIGSWFRRMQATAKAAVNSEMAQDLALTAVHAADAQLVLYKDATITATLLQNLAPVIASLQPTKDAAIRTGALLIVKVDWAVQVVQLTAAQQAILDHQPQLTSNPQQIVAALEGRAALSGNAPARCLPTLLDESSTLLAERGPTCSTMPPTLLEPARHAHRAELKSPVGHLPAAALHRWYEELGTRPASSISRPPCC